MALKDFPLPWLLFFASGNPFTGSYRGLNYRLDPVKEDPEQERPNRLTVAVWEGERCSQLSEMRATATFSLERDGLAAAEDWLRSQYAAFAS